MTTMPLTTRDPGEIIAWRNGHPYSVATLFGEAQLLAQRLPPARYAINRCHSRYRFMRGFLAVVMAGQTNLLPPDRLQQTTQRLLRDYPNAYILTDEAEGTDQPSASAVVSAQATALDDSHLAIGASHLAAIAFTSGSTGAPKPIEKPWYTLYQGARINAAAMGLTGGQTHNLLATVPPQHMYGLETSVLNPFVAPIAAADGQPLLPADIRAALEELPEPRVLVTTPAHLRSLADPAYKLPPLATIWSATAPLDPALARRIEQLHGAPIHEIYGCSEVGSLAQRHTSSSHDWRLFPGFSLADSTAAGTLIDAPHLPGSRIIPDRLARRDSGHFRILGRSEDMVNVAGKRSSLTELTQALQGLDGVCDGVVFKRPEHDEHQAARLVAMVVAPERDASSLRQALRGCVDDAFIPRPIHHVEALPRSETGKLTRNNLLECLAALEGYPQTSQQGA
jgi:acyl-coenzyme A synthetase/AMP-(fatty) acid ligase